MSMTQILNMILIALRSAAKGLQLKSCVTHPKAHEYSIKVNGTYFLLTPTALRVRKGSIRNSIPLSDLEQLTPEILAMDIWCLLSGVITPKEFCQQ